MGQESITATVREILMKNPQVCECLHFLNYTRLASTIRASVEKKTGARASTEAVKTAIRRFADANRKTKFYGDVRTVLRGGRLNLRNNVSVMVLYPGAHTMDKIPELEEKIDRRKGEMLHVVSGINCIVLMLDDTNYPAAEKIFAKDMFRSQTGLSAITITTSPKITGTPGVIAYITMLIARNGINIEEVESCYTDTVLIFKKNEAIRAYNLLEDAMVSENVIGPAAPKRKFVREPLLSAE